tara:strand:+ start:109 stop:345 length:237 start_codon:yes stop_codon:yes gene_type:complete
VTDIDFLSIRDELTYELSRLENSQAEIDNRIADLEEVRDRHEDLQSKLTDYISTLENIATDIEEVEIALDDAENLGVN